MAEELRDNFTLQQWLTIDSQFQGYARRGMTQEQMVRAAFTEIADWRDLVTICRFRADLPNW